MDYFNFMEGFIMKRITRAKNYFLSRLYEARELSRAGIGAMDILIVIIIGVVAAGIIIGLVQAAMPELWASLMAKITSLFS